MKIMPPDVNIYINLASPIFEHMKRTGWDGPSLRHVIENLKEEFMSDIHREGRGVTFHEVEEPKSRQAVNVPGDEKRERKYQAWVRTEIETAVAEQAKGSDKMLSKAQNEVKRLIDEGEKDISREQVSLLNDTPQLDKAQPSPENPRQTR
jgi:hypothetical protein